MKNLVNVNPTKLSNGEWGVWLSQENYLRLVNNNGGDTNLSGIKVLIRTRSGKEWEGILDECDWQSGSGSKWSYHKISRQESTTTPSTTTTSSPKRVLVRDCDGDSTCGCGRVGKGRCYYSYQECKDEGEIGSTSEWYWVEVKPTSPSTTSRPKQVSVDKGYDMLVDREGIKWGMESPTMRYGIKVVSTPQKDNEFRLDGGYLLDIYEEPHELNIGEMLSEEDGVKIYLVSK